MSFAFTVRGPETSPLTLGALRDALALDLETAEGLDPAGSLRGLSHIYRPGVTTRSIELDADATEAGIRILACASTEDHELAIRIAELVAKNRGVADVEPEGDDPIPMVEVRLRYDAEWVAEQIEFGAAAVARAVDEHPGRLITLAGPIRPFLVGERLVAELRASGPAEGFGARLIDAMRRTQWPADCFAASVMGISGGTSGRSIRLAVLTGRGRTLLPDVDAVALREPAGGQLYVPPGVVAELLPEQARYLDERHLLVDAIEEIGWTTFLAAAGPRAVDLDDL